MARPRKDRRVCRLPGTVRFGPLGGDGPYGVVTLSVDELEALRQTELEGLSQEDCAARMGVARSTVQALCGEARRKLTRCLVDGLELRVEGGNYRLCRGGGCGRCPCPAEIAKSDGTHHPNIKIAVTYQNGQVYQHFGHSRQFKLYRVEDGKVVSSAVEDTGGQGHGALAGFLKDRGVDTLICGGIGGGARMALEEAGIRLYGGVTGGADEAVAALLAGNLAYQPDIVCAHHHEGGDHDCGHHGDGSCGHGSCHS